MVTFAEEVLAKVSGEKTEAGDIVDASVDVAMSHDNAALVIKKFEEIGVKKVWDASRIVIILDHRVPANTIKTAEAHKKIRKFVKEQGIKNFYDINKGICHQVMIEEGHALPEKLIVGTDSHTTSYGAIGAFSTGIGATEMARLGNWEDMAACTRKLQNKDRREIARNGIFKRHYFPHHKTYAL